MESDEGEDGASGEFSEVTDGSLRRARSHLEHAHERLQKADEWLDDAPDDVDLTTRDWVKDGKARTADALMVVRKELDRRDAMEPGED